MEDLNKVKYPGRLNIVNRGEYKEFLPSPITHYKSKERIKSVQLQRTSHDAKYAEQKEKGIAIDITSNEIYVNGKKPMDGIFSPLFGADTTQDAPIYTCECHAMTGGTNQGRICPKCGTEVRTIEADLRLTGYIDIAPYHILSYHGMIAFSKIFKNFNDIISSVRRINRSGKIVKDEKPTIMELYKDYNEKYKGMIGLDRDIVFMSKIPVYSSRLRPLMTFGPMHLSMLEVNQFYLQIVTLANDLKVTKLIPGLKREMEVQRLLNEIQKNFNDVNNFVIERIKGKYGVFRRALASGRLDYSSRLVISLGTDLMAHEIDVPYQTMMVLYEEEIANALSKMYDIPMSRAISMVEEHQSEGDELFINIINQLLKSKKGIWCLINRNPTISESGILYSRIRQIHKDTTDYTLHLPRDILNLLAADLPFTVRVDMIVISYKKISERLTSGVCSSDLQANGRSNLRLGLRIPHSYYTKQHEHAS